MIAYNPRKRLSHGNPILAVMEDQLSSSCDLGDIYQNGFSMDIYGMHISVSMCLCDLYTNR